MIEAQIRFIGDAFQPDEWLNLMRQLDLRLTDYYPAKALLASNGNSIIGVETGFSRNESIQGFEWGSL